MDCFKALTAISAMFVDAHSSPLPFLPSFFFRTIDQLCNSRTGSKEFMRVLEVLVLR
jgi:hypothetical protein